jgi:hypothetical protein
MTVDAVGVLRAKGKKLQLLRLKGFLAILIRDQEAL